ncbi:hypothetical protein [Haliea sp.]|uniref:hypothetical protein n=1 Tax=Haliea sp. TaxID=1932666 RepID=UPI0035289040
MVSKAKLYAQLDRLEDELEERLVMHLEAAATGANDFAFCATDFRAASRPNDRIDAEADALVHLGRRILTLREKLGESSAGTPAERLCWYCRKWGEAGDDGRRAARELASDFLQEINQRLAGED